MKKGIWVRFSYLAIGALSFISAPTRAQQSWQKLNNPTRAQLESNFKDYPPEYAHTLTWGWDGPVGRESIIKDLDAIQGQGLKVVTIEAGYKMVNPYLSSGWFETVKIAVEEAKKRNMRVWIIDEGKYPSGFAGGKFSLEKPELRMQGLVVARRISLSEGQEIKETLPADIISAAAVNLQDRSHVLLRLNNRALHWKAPKGSWQILLIQHRFKTSVTRAANNPKGGKDTTNSLCDYLNPEATKQFLEFTHEQYKKYIGKEFGKTVLGFRGDEPDYGFTPWTPKMPTEFKKRKGYDIAPYLASFFTTGLSEEEKRAKADYWDVWSDLFKENFFDVQAAWCAKNQLEYMVHLNHEEKMMDLVRSSGDFFKNMRNVQVPGVDAIWNQVWFDKVADFPKLASSAAHLFGRPRALSESFAAYTIPPTVSQAKWCVDYQMVRGINLFEYMFWSGSAGGRGIPNSYLGKPEFRDLAVYSNRAAYLLAQGIPAAKIALYHPTTSMWLGDADADKSTLAISKQLLENQFDYDFVDEQALTETLNLEKNHLVNESGQGYQVIIIPSVTVISSEAFKRLKSFTKAGGMVIFLGNQPKYITDKNFLNMSMVPSAEWAVTEASGELTDRIKALLPRDVMFNKVAHSVKYLHRKLKDADLYFFFNEGESDQNLETTLKGSGEISCWDPLTAQIEPVKDVVSRNENVNFQMSIPGHGTRYFLIASSK
ncbi:glycosyl hydrolase [Pedobacter sp. P351]|uniref:glycosyl hydrolase n=1 Tax=Pedobacter superstes TaxID=3133441 RepID=UPI0030AF252A